MVVNAEAYNVREKKMMQMKVTDVIEIKTSGGSLRYRLAGVSTGKDKTKMSRFVSKKDAAKYAKQLKKPMKKEKS